MREPDVVLLRYTRFEEAIGRMRPAGAFVHTQELNGEDAVEFTCREDIAKGERLLWYDDFAVWREFIVVRIEEDAHGLRSVYAENSVCELLCDYVESSTASGASVTAALGAALANSRWGVAVCDVTGTHTAYLYHTNALAAVHKVMDIWGGELETLVTVGDFGVTQRRLRLVQRRGSDKGRRFQAGNNLGEAKRLVSEDEVYTALYGFGAGLPVESGGTWSGGYRRRLTFGDINGGLNYVTDETAKATWGRWNADRSAKVHCFGAVVFDNVYSQSELLAKTRAALAELNHPNVSYEADVINDYGSDHAEVGDTVAVVDFSRTPGWAAELRVMKRVRTYFDGVRTHLVLGHVPSVGYTVNATLGERMAAVEDCAGYASDQSTSNTTVADGLTEDVEELQGDVEGLQDDVSGLQTEVAALPTTSEMNAAIAAAIAELDQLNEVEF